MLDRWAVVVALAVWSGAVLHRGPPLLVAGAVVLVAFAARDVRLLAVGGLLLGASLGQRSWSGLEPVAPGPAQATVTLLSDPSPGRFGTEVEVRLGPKHVLARAYGSAAGALAAAAAGERVAVQGALRPPPPGAAWMRPRHLVGVLVVSHAERVGLGAPPWRAANALRDLVARGTTTMGPTTRALYLGFVFGDDRGQPPEVVDDFRGSGLSHVLVVSGENLAFVMALLAPLRDRLAWRWRWALTIGAISAFGLVTRFEPSVLRACAMAAIVVTAGAVGRPTAALRALALAVAGLVLVDPLLVWSVGFQLSVAASLSIALLASPLAARLPGPRPLAEVLAVTAAAQLGVAPVLLPQFGGIPVASLLANPLAVPVAGLVTTYGLPAGVVAGIFGGRAGALASLPTQGLVGWVAGVARVAASLPLGELGVRHVVALVVLGACWWHGSSGVRRVAVVGIALVLVAPAVGLRSPPPRQALASGASIVRSQGATCLDVASSVAVDDLLADLRRAGVHSITELRAPPDELPELVRAIGHRWPIGRAVGSGGDGASHGDRSGGGARCPPG